MELWKTWTVRSLPAFPSADTEPNGPANSNQALQENRHETASQRILPDSQINIVLWAGTHAQTQADQAWSSTN